MSKTNVIYDFLVPLFYNNRKLKLLSLIIFFLSVIYQTFGTFTHKAIKGNSDGKKRNALMALEEQTHI